MIIRPSVSTPSTSSSNKEIFCAFLRRPLEIRFTEPSNSCLENIVEMNDADGFLVPIKHKKTSDRARRVFFHFRQRLSGENIFFDGSGPCGHDLGGSFAEDRIAVRLQPAAQIAISDHSDQTAVPVDDPGDAKPFRSDFKERF